MAMTYSTQFNLDQLKQSLFRKKENVAAAVVEAVDEGAKEIMEEAKANAPVDTHNLEEAIHISKRETRAGNIAIDIECSGAGNEGRDVAEYAMEVHERLEPAPGADMHLGPGSQAKQASDPTHTVGGKFMDRAVEAKKALVINEIRKAVRGAVNK